MKTRIALIHALMHSIAPINAAFEAMWPECERMNVLDDSLSADLARSAGGLNAAMTARFMALAGYVVGTGAQGILFTCSAFGPCIEAVKDAWPDLPVLKPNEATVEEAVAIARRGTGRVAVVATFAPTLVSMPPEFPMDIEVTTVFVPGAMDALNAGDGATHDRLIAAAMADVRDVDVAILAQFSMARAAGTAALATAIPLLTTPGSAVQGLRHMIANGIEQRRVPIR